jgi:translation initiation factor 5A
MNIDDGFMSLMGDTGDTKDDIRLPEGDLGKEIQDKFDTGEQFMVTVLKACKEEVAIATKAMTK